MKATKIIIKNLFGIKEAKTWADYMNMVAAGLLKPEIAVGWRFGMPTETPEDLAKIREKYMPEPEGLTAGGDDDV